MTAVELFSKKVQAAVLYVWLLKEEFSVCSVYYSSSVNGSNFKEKFSLAYFCFYLHFEHFHTAAFFRHERWPQEYFHISCGTILRKLNKTP